MNINEMIGEYLNALKGIGSDKQYRRIRDERLMGLEFYQGDQLEYLEKRYINIPNVTLVTDNITRRVVQEWSMVYREEPEYSSEKLLEVFPHRVEMMKSCERYRNLIGVVLVRPMIVNGKGQHDIILDFMPFFDMDSPDDSPVAYAYPYKNGQFNLWTKDEVIIFDGDGKKKETMPNEYGELPFVPAFVEYGEWNHTGMNDVVRSNLVYNEGLTNLHHTHYFQSFKVPYLVSSSSLNGIKLDLDVSKPIVIENAADANIGMLDLGANFTESINVLKFTLDRTLSNYHMRADFDESGNPSSGFSIIARKSGLLEARSAMIEGWMAFEDELFKVERLVCEKNGISLDKENTVIFKDQQAVTDPKEEREMWDWWFDNGLKDKKDYYIEEFGMDEREAEEKVAGEQGQFLTALKAPVNE